MALAAALLVAATSAAEAATLTITPDKAIYAVGETIMLSIVGDSEGGADSFVTGRLVFDASLAEYVTGSQTPLTSFGGAVPWATFPVGGGAGFADAFHQIVSPNPFPVDNLLEATVILIATAPGSLDIAWGSIGVELRFFGLTSAPGVSVTLVPEPATLLLVSAGVLALAQRRRSQEHRIG
jgi:hypothetical protein